MVEKMTSLLGKNILVTRAAAQSKPLADLLTGLGAMVIEKPFLEIGPPDTWEYFDRALQNIDSYDWLLLASNNSVQAFVSRLNANQVKLPSKLKIAAIGQATKDALEKHDIVCNFYPSKYIAESLVHEFPGYPSLAGLKILWPRTNVGRTYIIDEFVKCGAIVDAVPGYKTTLPQNMESLADEIKTLLQNSQLDVITLASAQTVKNFALIMKNKGLNSSEFSGLLGLCRLASIGPETSKAIKEEFGIEPAIEATRYTIEGLVEAIGAHFNANSRTNSQP